jgi:hypothetical protein
LSSVFRELSAMDRMCNLRSDPFRFGSHRVLFQNSTGRAS